MPVKPGETMLNQMKRSGASQQSVTVTALGQAVVPYSESRVALVLSSLAGTVLTYSLRPQVGVGAGITIPAGGAPVALSLASHGSVVKGPIYLADGTVPSTITYWESLNDAP